jgi:hypothetical protein
MVGPGKGLFVPLALAVTFAMMASYPEVFGDLNEGDLVVRLGTDELRPGTPATAIRTSLAR